MAFVVLLSATEMNGNFEKFKEKRRMRHAVTILVGVTILFALIIVIGIILAFELPPKNRKFAAEKVPLPEGDEAWKNDVRAVFAVNLVGQKDARLRRSTENVHRFTVEVLRTLLSQFDGSDARFALQLYTVPGNSSFGEFCDTACLLNSVSDIEGIAYPFDNPNQTNAIAEYYQYSAEHESSPYILFVADRSCYSDANVFKNDMEQSRSVLEKTGLDQLTTKVALSTDATQYFPDSILSDGTSASEIANLINDRLISFYRTNGNGAGLTTSEVTPVLPQLTEIQLLDITASSTSKSSDIMLDDIQLTSSTEFIQPATIFQYTEGLLNESRPVAHTTSPAISFTLKTDERTATQVPSDESAQSSSANSFGTAFRQWPTNSTQSSPTLAQSQLTPDDRNSRITASTKSIEFNEAVTSSRNSNIVIEFSGTTAFPIATENITTALNYIVNGPSKATFPPLRVDTSPAGNLTTHPTSTLSVLGPDRASSGTTNSADALRFMTSNRGNESFVDNSGSVGELMQATSTVAGGLPGSTITFGTGTGRDTQKTFVLPQSTGFFATNEIKETAQNPETTTSTTKHLFTDHEILEQGKTRGGETLYSGTIRVVDGSSLTETIGSAPTFHSSQSTKKSNERTGHSQSFLGIIPSQEDDKTMLTTTSTLSIPLPSISLSVSLLPPSSTTTPPSQTTNSFNTVIDNTDHKLITTPLTEVENPKSSLDFGFTTLETTGITVPPVLSPNMAVTSIGMVVPGHANSAEEAIVTGNKTVSTTPSFISAIDDFAYLLEDLLVPESTSVINTDSSAKSTEGLNSLISVITSSPTQLTATESSPGSIKNQSKLQLTNSSFLQDLTSFRSNSFDYQIIDNLSQQAEKVLRNDSRTENTKISNIDFSKSSAVTDNATVFQETTAKPSLTTEESEQSTVRTMQATVESPPINTSPGTSSRSSLPLDSELLTSLSDYWKTISEQSFATSSNRLFSFAETTNSGVPVGSTATVVPPDAVFFLSTIPQKNRTIQESFNGNTIVQTVSSDVTANSDISVKEKASFSAHTSAATVDTSENRDIVTEVSTTEILLPEISTEQTSAFSSPITEHSMFTNPETIQFSAGTTTTTIAAAGSASTNSVKTELLEDVSATTETPAFGILVTENSVIKGETAGTTQTATTSQFLDNIVAPAIFNVTIPTTMLDVETRAFINRTSNDYSYLLLDEASYSDQNDLSDQTPKMAFSIDDKSIALDESAIEGNEPENNLYSYEVTDTPQPSVDEIALQRLNLMLSLKGKPTVKELPSPTSTMTTNVDGSLEQANVFTVPGGKILSSSSSPVGASSSPVSIIDFQKVTLASGSPEDITTSVITEKFRKDYDESESLTHDLEKQPYVESTTSTALETTGTTNSLLETQLPNQILTFGTESVSEIGHDQPAFLLETDAVTKPGLDKTNPEIGHDQFGILLEKSTTPKPGQDEIAPLKTNHRKTVHKVPTILKLENNSEDENSTSTSVSDPGKLTFEKEYSSTTVSPADNVFAVSLEKTTKPSLGANLESAEDSEKFQEGYHHTSTETLPDFSAESPQPSSTSSYSQQIHSAESVAASSVNSASEKQDQISADFGTTTWASIDPNTLNQFPHMKANNSNSEEQAGVIRTNTDNSTSADLETTTWTGSDVSNQVSRSPEADNNNPEERVDALWTATDNSTNRDFETTTETSSNSDIFNQVSRSSETDNRSPEQQVGALWITTVNSTNTNYGTTAQIGSDSGISNPVSRNPEADNSNTKDRVGASETSDDNSTSRNFETTTWVSNDSDISNQVFHNSEASSNPEEQADALSSTANNSTSRNFEPIIETSSDSDISNQISHNPKTESKNPEDRASWANFENSTNRDFESTAWAGSSSDTSNQAFGNPGADENNSEEQLDALRTTADNSTDRNFGATVETSSDSDISNQVFRNPETDISNPEERIGAFRTTTDSSTNKPVEPPATDGTSVDPLKSSISSTSNSSLGGVPPEAEVFFSVRGSSEQPTSSSRNLHTSTVSGNDSEPGTSRSQDTDPSGLNDELTNVRLVVAEGDELRRIESQTESSNSSSKIMASSGDFL